MKLTYISKGLYLNRKYGLTLTGCKGNWTLTADSKCGFVFTGLDSQAARASASRTVVGIRSISQAEALDRGNVIVCALEQQLLPLFPSDDSVLSAVMIPSQGWLELPLIECLRHDELRCARRR